MATALQDHILSPQSYALKDEFMGTKGSTVNSEQFKHIPSNDSSKYEAPGSIVSRLKNQNKNLEYQLQSLKFQLQQFLERKKTLGERSESFPKPGYMMHSSMEEDPRMQKLRKKLETVYNEIDFYKKEIKIFQLGHSDVKVLDKFKDSENKLNEKKIELRCLELEKKTLEKTLKEKGDLLRELQDINQKVASFRESELPISEELKHYKSKVRDTQSRQQELEKDAQKKNQYILKIMGKLTTLKEDYRQMLTRTGYDPVEDRIKSTKASVSPIKRPVRLLAYSPTLNIKKEEEEQPSVRLETNEDNFEKLKEEVKEYKKLELQKEKAFKLQMDRYREMLEVLKNGTQEANKKLDEKEMEASILRNKTKDLYRQLLQLGLLPPGYDYEGLLKEKQNNKAPSGAKKYSGRRSFSVATGEGSNYLRTSETPRGLKNKAGKNSRMDTGEDINEPLSAVSASQHRKLGSSAFGVKQSAKGRHAEDDRSNRGREISHASSGETPKSGKKSSLMSKNSQNPGKQYPESDDFEEGMPNVGLESMVKGLVYHGYRMDEVGQKMEKEGSKNFNDQEKIQGNHCKISKVRVFCDGDDVAGFQTEYRNKQGQIIKGDEYTYDNGKYKYVELTMGGDDYLKEVSGFINETNDQIESVCLVSNEGLFVKAGKEKEGNEPFTFDINELEYPIMLHGSLRGKQNGKGSIVCRFGALIKSDEIEENIEERGEHRASNGGKKLKQINK